MGLEGVNPSHHTLPTPMGQLQSTTTSQDGEEQRGQQQQQQQTIATAEKNIVNANANSMSPYSSSGNPNINPLSASSSTNTFINTRPASFSPAALPPASSAQLQTSTSGTRPQVNGSGNVNYKNGSGPRVVEPIPWPPARPISSGPLSQANGSGRMNFGSGNPPRRTVEFIPFQPHKSVQRGVSNVNPIPGPMPRAPQPQTNFTSSPNTTPGTVVRPPAVNTPPATPTTQPAPPPLNGSTDQSNMGRAKATTTASVNGTVPMTAPTTQPAPSPLNRSTDQSNMDHPKTTTTAPSIATKPTMFVNGTAPMTAPINAPLVPATPTPAIPPPASSAPAIPTPVPVTTVTKVAKVTASTPKPLKRKATSTPRGGGAKRGRKRKSAKFDDDEDVIKVGDTSTSSDESDDPTPITTMTKSGRQVHRPTAFVPPPEPQQETDVSTAANQEKQQTQRKKRRTYRKGRENNVTCVRCWRGHSPASNVIVFCDECNAAWHQFCHDPPIENEVIIVKEAQWFCRECRPVENGSSGLRLQDRPVPNEVFPVASQVLVGGERFTSDQRRGYLAGLSHAALVKILVDISNSQPDVAIFPENMLELRSATVLPPAPPKASKASLDLSITTPNKSIPTTSPALPPTQPTTTTAQLPPAEPTMPQPSTPIPIPTAADLGDEPLSTDHRLYPRAGNGFHLPPETADLDMLLEDPSCTTFSHALHGRAKTRVEVEGRSVQVVGGVA